MKTAYTAKTADLTAAANSIDPYTEEGAKEAAKIRKMAAKMGYDAGYGFDRALQAMLLKKIQFGAIRIGGTWRAVVNGEIVARSSHTYSTGAVAEAAMVARNYGVTVKM